MPIAAPISVSQASEHLADFLDPGERTGSTSSQSVIADQK